MAQQHFQPSALDSNLATLAQASQAERPKTLVQQSFKTCIQKKMAYAVDSPRKHALDNLVAQFVVLDMQPFTVVEDRGFHTLMNAMDPRYSLPSRRELTRTLIPNLYREEYANLQKELNDAEFITLTTDDWTSWSTKGYMAVTAHFVDSQMQLKSKIIEIRRITSSQTADRIAEELRGIMSAWDITTKVFAIVTDNAANMIAAIKKLPVYHVPCFAHTLNIVVQDSLKNLRTLSSAREKVRAKVSHFNVSIPIKIK
ncbi:zinc finger BED domain-containing protein 1-like [Aplysia californica]|uniref:Zinc finger BED domain-containing protein 1-like n=1 Tax=Aplysia californica TaxID=6500 RepID=A0ABM0JKK2_APLCA|nr:zinc finger BED domain-containing protein 1-like [Aplysia californica]